MSTEEGNNKVFCLEALWRTIVPASHTSRARIHNRHAYPLVLSLLEPYLLERNTA